MAEIICHAVCQHYGVDEEEVRGISRAHVYLRPRQIAMYLIRRLTGLSYQQVGEYFGRNHTTAMHSYKIAQRDMNRSPQLTEDVEHLVSVLETAGAGKVPGESVLRLRRISGNLDAVIAMLQNMREQNCGVVNVSVTLMEESGGSSAHRSGQR